MRDVEPWRERQRHSHRRMDPRLKKIDDLLEELWREIRDGRIETDWQPITIIGRVMKQGVTGAAQRGAPLAPLSRKLRLVLAAVGRLPTEQQEILAEEHGYSRQFPNGIKVRRLNRRLGWRFGETKYNDLLRSARNGLHALLFGDECQ